MNIQRTARRKKSVNLSIDPEALAAARAQGLNLSHLLETALRQLRETEWKAENAEAIRETNERVAREGLWSSKMRMW